MKVQVLKEIPVQMKKITRRRKKRRRTKKNNNKELIRIEILIILNIRRQVRVNLDKRREKNKVQCFIIIMDIIIQNLDQKVGKVHMIHINLEDSKMNKIL